MEDGKSAGGGGEGGAPFSADELFREILQKEAEQNFAIFMLDMIEDNCE